MRIFLSLVLGLAVSLVGGCGTIDERTAGPAALFDGWYQVDAQQADYPQSLWQLLMPIGIAGEVGDAVHLQVVDEHQMQASLYQAGRCVQHVSLDGSWDGQRFHNKQSTFDGLPPLVWGTQRRALQLRPDPHGMLHVDEHSTSFGMFLIIASGAPDRDRTYRFSPLQAPAAVPGICPGQAADR